ncbi:MAG: thioester reductase domain-containing protein [Chloroflexi bacterium]|nr:thioester reductase domain-containing protein [Chloroflexota bacterium]
MANSITNLDRRAVLDPSIVPLETPVDLTTEPECIFLTGVTGFVGAYLLRDLLETTGADVYCLVRAYTPEHALQRIRQNLDSYLIWKDDYQRRIKPVVGDLKLPRFGLAPDAFEKLAEDMDSLYHCGSKLSYIAPYDYLEAANVGGTQEGLRLATSVKAKPFHFVSSLGILLAYKDLNGGNEADDLDETKCPEVGYFQTKYVAEKVVRIARDRGIPVTIHRIGLIVGDSQTGASNVDDFVARMMIGSIQAGYAPDIHNLMDMTPVDFVSAAMVYLSRQPESVGQVFHLLNPTPIHWSDIFDLVIEAGYPVKKLAFNQWVEAIEERANPDCNPLHPLLPFFHIDFARRMLGVSDSAYYALGTAATQRALAGSGIGCPPIDRRLIHTFLSRFAHNGRLEWEPISPEKITSRAVPVG